MNHFDSYVEFVKAQPLSDELKDALILRFSHAQHDAYQRGQAQGEGPDAEDARRRIQERDDARLSRTQILKVLKQKGWTRKRGLFFKDRGPGRNGVDLRAAASLEFLSSRDCLSMPVRRRKSSDKTLRQLTQKEIAVARRIKNADPSKLEDGDGGMIPAIKYVRELTNASLYDAKVFVERL